MDFEVKSYQVNVKGEFEWGFTYLFYHDGVTRLCPTVKGFATKAEAEEAAKDPVHVENAEAYQASVYGLTTIKPIYYIVPPEENVQRKRYAKIASVKQKPGDPYIVVAFKNDTVRRASAVRARENGYKFWDATRKEISTQQADNAPVFETSDVFRKYIRHHLTT